MHAIAIELTCKLEPSLLTQCCTLETLIPAAKQTILYKFIWKFKIRTQYWSSYKTYWSTSKKRIVKFYWEGERYRCAFYKQSSFLGEGVVASCPEKWQSEEGSRCTQDGDLPTRTWTSSILIFAPFWFFFLTLIDFHCETTGKLNYYLLSFCKCLIKQKWDQVFRIKIGIRTN